MGVAKVGHVVEGIVLVAVLDPDLLAANLPDYRWCLFQVDIVRFQHFNELGIAGDFIVVVTGQHGDLDCLPGIL